jgi:lipoprotein-anchoring transpeptidase ErfK/SrfK
MRVRRHGACSALVILIALTSAAANAAANAAPVSGEIRSALAWQLALEREGFSPGLIDGNPGRKTALATAHFQRANGLPATGKLDPATSALLRIDPDGALATYTIQDADAALVAPPPKKWVEKSRAKLLGYESLADCVAEKFHCSEGLLASLNPGTRTTNLMVGNTLTVPAVQAPKPLYANRLEIDLGEKTVRAFDGDMIVALFHCSIARDAAKRPSGEARITAVTNNPAYSFDPAMWPEVKDVKQKLQIPPGPRNPVGLCWMALSLPGYGIHGTPNPEMIGKTGSHGCFRLTNWDAVRLGKMVSSGTSVKFLDAPSGTRLVNAD